MISDTAISVPQQGEGRQLIRCDRALIQLLSAGRNSVLYDRLALLHNIPIIQRMHDS